MVQGRSRWKGLFFAIRLLYMYKLPYKTVVFISNQTWRWLVQLTLLENWAKDQSTCHVFYFIPTCSSASFSGHVSLLRWLLTHGATVDTDDLGGTPLHDAAEHGQMEVRSISCTQSLVIMHPTHLQALN